MSTIASLTNVLYFALNHSARAQHLLPSWTLSASQLISCESVPVPLIEPLAGLRRLLLQTMHGCSWRQRRLDRMHLAPPRRLQCCARYDRSGGLRGRLLDVLHEAVMQQREKELSLQLEALQGQVGAQQRLIMVTTRSVPLLGGWLTAVSTQSGRQCNLAMPQQ